MRHIQKERLPCLPRSSQPQSHWVCVMNFVKNGIWMIRISLKMQIGELRVPLPKPGGSKARCTKSQPHFKMQGCQTDSIKHQKRFIIACQLSKTQLNLPDLRMF